MNEEKRELPPGWEVVYKPSIGYEFSNMDFPRIIYHPVDDNAIRALVWHIHNKEVEDE